MGLGWEAPRGKRNTVSGGKQEMRSNRILSQKVRMEDGWLAGWMDEEAPPPNTVHVT